MALVSDPETYHLPPTPHCPNNTLPLLVYRNALPAPPTEDSSKAFLERHNAWKWDGTWGHIAIRHFHPNTHECYGVFSGTSTVLVGCGKGDQPDPANGLGVEIRVAAGDVIVLPAGTGHCNTSSSEDYKYVGVYPTVSLPNTDSLLLCRRRHGSCVVQNAPKWRFELGAEEGDNTKFKDELASVKLPEADPVAGPEGPLMRLWVQSRA